MSDPFIGEIRMFGGSFAPAAWAFCDGQLMPIAQNDALFSLIGTTYGGDGQETFAVPDLQGRVPMHMGTGSSGTPYVEGEKAGVESVTLTTQQIPQHNHAFLASTTTGNSVTPTDNLTGNSAQVTFYALGTAITTMLGQAIQPVGGSQPHDNMQPYLTLSFIISLYGIFPSQT